MRESSKERSFWDAFSPKRPADATGPHILKQVRQYKYLGIELTRTVKWNVYTKRTLKSNTKYDTRLGDGY